jgi:catechol 2,3-dioxygenase-like lactoylglutathione lyase family enzyme
MLNTCDAMATIAVKDIATARAFYEGKLGLTLAGEAEPGMVPLRRGNTTVLLYESAFAGTNKANAATWNVTGDIDALVRDLRAKGVPFEHYDMPDTRREGDIHVSGDRRVAWARDPDGNLLCLAKG